ncbi:hypothetical protein Dsin_019664 [Dipteronia sinensis]|uniref:RNase H type-1 domain-containing protein n=1 Tax=Dipteronia sinensis TaxID=43782 RepID=A0AAE0E314_9ROSI|nr:hypothetical protein Dsin_019664 [Dipteronia sinensis]
MDVFLFSLSHFDKDALCRLCMLAWAIWENRNSFHNSGKGKCAELVVSGAEALLSEFQLSKLASSVRPLPPTSWSSAEWLAPPPGRFKLNYAVAYRKNVKSIGVGVAILDDKGLMIKAFLLEPGCCKCQAISKSRNSLAHKLALMAFSSAREFLWLDSSPVVPLCL